VVVKVNGEYEKNFGKIFERLNNQEKLLQEIRDDLRALDKLNERVLKLELWAKTHEKYHLDINQEVRINKTTILTILSILAAGGLFGYIFRLIIGG
jgi:glutaredoxin 2